MRRLAIVVALAACQGNRNNAGDNSGSGDVPPPVGDASAADPLLGDAFAAADDAAPSDARIDEPEPADPGKVIADLGAIPAWQAVVDRSQLLARRGQHGVVYGRLGPAIMVLGPTPPPVDAGVPIDAGMIQSPYVWLADDTEGNGALGIRVMLGGRKVKEGDRVALGGAWQLDEERRWYWKVDVVQPLQPAPKSDSKDPVAPFPSHTVPNGDLPYGARTITIAKEGDAAFFAVVGPPPQNDGEGWPVANELGDPVYGLLTLPGERASYGAQDMRSPDERWQLKRGQMYWVRIGVLRKRAPDKPVAITAKTAPVRVK